MPDTMFVQDKNDESSQKMTSFGSEPSQSSNESDAFLGSAENVTIRRLDGMEENQKDISQEDGMVNISVDSKTRNTPDRGVSVYSMPKEFLKVKPPKPAKQGKTSGGSGSGKKAPIIIIIVGIILIAGIAAAYFFIIAPKLNQNPEDTPPPVEIPTDTETPEDPTGGEINDDTEEPTEEPDVETDDNGGERDGTVLEGDLFQKVKESHDGEGQITTTAVLSLEREEDVNYDLISLEEHIVEAKTEYFDFVGGAAYSLKLRGEDPSAVSVLTISYTPDVLEEHDLIPADLRIGYMPFEILEREIYKTEDGMVILINASGTMESTTQEPEIWQLLKASEVDAEMGSVSSVLDDVQEGIYAIVPIYVNKMITLPLYKAEEPDDPEEPDILRAKDTDDDLLSDTEERLYGTSPLERDSDEDGYADGTEVMLLFSPARGAGVSLESDAQFERYENTEVQYSVLKPKNFSARRVIEASARDILFVSENQETVLLSIQSNPQGLDLKDWLISLSPQTPLDIFTEFTTQQGYSALQLNNQTAYYVLVPGAKTSVYVFSYSSSFEYSYMTTFRMMVESFRYTGSVSTGDQETEENPRSSEDGTGV